METIEKLKADHKLLGERIAKLENQEDKPHGRWKPDKGTFYFMINAYGFVRHVVCAGKNYERQQFAIGNCYKTGEEADQHQKKLIATRKVIDAIAEVNEGWEPDFNDASQGKYCIYYDYHRGVLNYDDTYVHQPLPKEYYFRDSSMFSRIVKLAGEDNIKLHLGVEND